MGVRVAYVSDQRFFRAGERWYTTASFPLPFICERLDVSEWTFWGRLDDVEDPGRLHPLGVGARSATRVRFAGPRRQAPGPLAYAGGALLQAANLRDVVRGADVLWLKMPFVYTILGFGFRRPGQVVVSQQVGDGRAGLVMGYPRWAALGGSMERWCRQLAAAADVPTFVSRDLARRYAGGRADAMVSNESRVEEAMVLPAPLPKPTSPLEVIFVGRLAPEKRVQDLLHAARLFPGARLTVVGEGPERPGLERLSRELGIGDRVAWRGYVGWGPTLFEQLRRASVLVLPSATEGLPLVALEAMSQGVPVIATRVGGIPEVVRDGRSGVLVEVGRPDQIAAAFRALVAEEGLLERLSAGALQIARENTLERQLGPLLDRIAAMREAREARPAGLSHAG